MLLWLSLSSCGDSNLLDQKQIKRVIKETLEKIDLSSKKGNELVYHTGLVESKYVYLMQKGGNNVARGLFQCEPWVAVDICKNYLQLLSYNLLYIYDLFLDYHLTQIY